MLAVFSKCVLENSGAGIKYKYLILRQPYKEKKKYIFVLFLLPDQFFLLFLLSLTSLHLLIKRLISSLVKSQQIFLKIQQLLWLFLWYTIMAHTRMCWVSSYIITSPTRLSASNSTSLESSATCCAESPLLFSNFILGRLWHRGQLKIPLIILQRL